MMKKAITLMLFILPLSLSAQEIHEKIAMEICNCIDTLENIDSLEAKVDRCAYDAFDAVIEASSDEVQEIYSTDDAVEQTMKKAMESLMVVCPKVRAFIINQRKDLFYKSSASEEANRLYESGNVAFGKEDYKGALALYLKALKKDKEFVYAIDNTGLTYRKMGDNKKAMKYYLRSLGIYPEGSVALQNLAFVYSIEKDLKNALTCYQKLAFFYPENPEGYFGIGKIYVVVGEYEEAMDYVFTAHRLYTATNSPYLKDSEELISIIYNKLKEANKTEGFMKNAEEFGIHLN